MGQDNEQRHLPPCTRNMKMGLLDGVSGSASAAGEQRIGKAVALDIRLKDRPAVVVFHGLNRETITGREFAP